MGNAASFTGDGTATTGHGNYLRSSATIARATVASFTWCGWVKCSLNTYMDLAKHGISTAAWQLVRSPGGLATVFAYDSADGISGSNVTLNGPALATGSFVFITIKFDASTKVMGISLNNGSFTSTAAMTNGVTPLVGSANVQLGGNFNGYNWFSGLIDQVFYYPRVLTAGEITWLYNSGNGRAYSETGAADAGLNLRASSSSDIIGCWELEEASGGTGAVTRTEASGFGPTLTDNSATSPSTVFVSSGSGIVASGGGTTLNALASTLTSFTPTTVTVAANFSGGTSNFSAKLHRIATPGTAINAGNVVSSATGQSASPIALSDTPPDDSIWYYVCEVTDSSGSPQTAVAASIGAARRKPDVKVVVLGDSITTAFTTASPSGFQGDMDLSISGNSGIPPIMGGYLNLWACGQRSIAVNSQAVQGQASINFAPSHVNPVGGATVADGSLWSVSKAAIDSAVAAYGAAYVIVSYELGTNDAPGGYSATNLANVAATVGYVRSVGAKIVIHDMPYNLGASVNAFALLWHTALDTLADGVTCFRDKNRVAQRYTANTPFATWTPDGTHPNTTGVANLAYLRATAIQSVMEPSGAATVGGTSTPSPIFFGG